ncbi:MULTISPECIES: hypothetical protein [Alphaproteobacteria]|uniref:hypothetical protein n=1 Tax=Alphaproteobacteria TaxID=28211 RepID=UPI0011BFD3CC|nr:MULTISPECIES: hypothetical protein [Alphaproteobacteria]
MTSQTAEFGYWPDNISIRNAEVTIEPLPGLRKVVASVNDDEGVENDWLYAPPQQVVGLGTGVRTLPYPARVFGLPKTHRITLANSDDPEHIAFHLWALSFFVGLRLTATEAGFLDATPIRSGKLVDFVLLRTGLETAVDLAEQFWITNRAKAQCARLFGGSVHALFLAQNPRHLQFEKFILLYTAFDACFALAKLLHPQRPRPSCHAERVQWMCELLGISTPAWADPSTPAGPEVATLRNATLHEALFMGQPLGFAVHGVGTNQNLTLEMQALTCRLLVALIGGAASTYVRTPTNTRQRHAMELP